MSQDTNEKTAVKDKETTENQDSKIGQEQIQEIINSKIGKEREKLEKSQAEIEQQISQLETKYNAQLTEYKTQLDDAKAKLTDYETRDKKLSALREAGLPEILVHNIVGDDDEAVKQSIKSLKEATQLMAQNYSNPIINSEKEPAKKDLSTEFTKLVRERLG
jgi:hypothetical protein